MRNILDIIHEAFASPVAWDWTRRTQIEWEASFVIGAMTYEVSIFREAPGTYDIAFSAHRTEEGNMYGTQRATGTGNAFAVYATVIEIVQQFDDEMGSLVKAYTFGSDTTEPKRHAVNQGIAKRIVAALSDDFEILDSGDEIVLKKVGEDDEEDDY